MKTDGGPATGAATQRRRLALLALLAVARDRGVSRDRLLAYLWPESDAERARHVLAQSLYVLRRDLAEDALFEGTAELRLNSAVATSDVAEFEQALDRGEPERAVALYGGPFLDGFHLPDVPDFERWVDDERARLARRYAAALERLAEGASARGEHRAAAGWWRQLAAVDPLSSRVTLRLMSALAASGDRGGALQHARVHETLLRQELDAPPDTAVAALAERLRDETAPPPEPVGPAAAAPVVAASGLQADVAGGPLLVAVDANGAAGTLADSNAATPAREAAHTPYHRDTPARLMRTADFEVAEPVPPGRAPPLGTRNRAGPLTHPGSRPVRGRALAVSPAGWVAVGAVLMLAAGATVALRSRGHARAMPVIAVGLVRDYTGADSIGGRAIPDMLATNLARVRGLHVVTTGRMYELVGQMRSSGASASPASSDSVAAAARRAGATQLVEGALYRRPDGGLRFDVRLVALQGRGVLKAYTVEGADAYALVDRATAELAADFDARGDTLHIGDVTTRSLAAYRLYEQGLRAWYEQGLAREALRLYVAALAEDSTFAMAAHNAFLAAIALGEDARAEDFGAQAVRMADRATDRERLLILSEWSYHFNEPASIAYAETLAVRYPTDPDGEYILGSALSEAGDFLGAVAHLRRVVAMDSVGLHGSGSGTSPQCRACDAVAFIVGVYVLADSMAAAERTAREFVRTRPRYLGAHWILANLLEHEGREAEAEAEYHIAEQLVPSRPFDVALRHSEMAIRRGDFARADSVLAPTLADSDVPLRGAALWNRLISLRDQGRPREALAEAQRWAADVLRTDTAARPPVRARGFEPQILFELGRYRESAAIIDSLRAFPQYPRWHQGKWARGEVWSLTHMAEALAAAGDTARLAPIADTMAMLGARSLYGRDRRLPHHVRGLLWLARGRPAEAEAELHEAIYSPTSGYTRTNLALGRLLLARRRPREAAAVVAPALRGPLDASNLYVTQTELHELLAQAYDAAGQADSAAAHYRWVVTAWQRADPPFRPRWEAARARLAALEGRPVEMAR